MAAGAIATGMVATSRSTTTTISIATIISTATSVAMDKVIGSTIPKTEATRPTGIGKQQINTEVKALAAPAALEIAKPELELETVPVPELELGIVPAAGLALGIVRAVAEQGIAQVEVELAIVLAVAEQGIVQVEVALELLIALAEGLELEIGLPLAHLAVLLRTRSVIAAHRRGLVPVLGAEDLVGAVETKPERVAVEAVTAWAAVA